MRAIHIKSYLLLFIAVLSLTAFSRQETSPLSSQDTIKVYIFLHENCLISQYYTLQLKELHGSYSSSTIEFIGVFPNYSSKVESIQTFKEKYQIPFTLKTDHAHTITEAFNATVTPEVIVYNESETTVIYQGRIDNAYARVGKRRRFTNTSELKDVLEALTLNKPILVAETISIGCFINKKVSEETIK